MASVFNPAVGFLCFTDAIAGFFLSSYLCCQYLCCLHVRLSVYCNWMAVMVSVFALFCEVVCPSTSVTDAAVCKSAERGRQICHIYLQACDRLFLWSTFRIHLKFHWRVTQQSSAGVTLTASHQPASTLTWTDHHLHSLFPPPPPPLLLHLERLRWSLIVSWTMSQLHFTSVNHLFSFYHGCTKKPSSHRNDDFEGI